MSQSHTLSLLVNAGGKSQRMGYPKALLPVPPSGTPLIQHTIRNLQPLASRTVVVANDKNVIAAAAREGCQVVVDRYPNAGPLGGLATGLAFCDGWTMVVACDMPFASAKTFCYLAERALETEPTIDETAAVDRWDAVVPFVDGYAQTTHALYHPRCLPAIVEMIAQDDLRITNLLLRVRSLYVYPDELQSMSQATDAFINVNTPEEWRAAQERLGK